MPDELSNIGLLEALVDENDSNSPAVSLVFEQILVNVIIHDPVGDGVENYDFSQVSVSIDGMSVTANLSLAD